MESLREVFKEIDLVPCHAHVARLLFFQAALFSGLHTRQGVFGTVHAACSAVMLRHLQKFWFSPQDGSNVITVIELKARMLRSADSCKGFGNASHLTLRRAC